MNYNYAFLSHCRRSPGARLNASSSSSDNDSGDERRRLEQIDRYANNADEDVNEDVLIGASDNETVDKTSEQEDIEHLIDNFDFAEPDPDTIPETQFPPEEDFAPNSDTERGEFYMSDYNPEEENKNDGDYIPSQHSEDEFAKDAQQISSTDAKKQRTQR